MSQNRTVGVLNTAEHWTVIPELQPFHYINFVTGPIFVHDSETGPCGFNLNTRYSTAVNKIHKF
jgi:hypothetical protein